MSALPSMFLKLFFLRRFFLFAEKKKRQKKKFYSFFSAFSFSKRSARTLVVR